MIIGYDGYCTYYSPPAILNCIANYSRLYCISSYTADYITCTQTSARTHASYESYTMNAYTSSFASSCPFKSYYLNIYQLVLSAPKLNVHVDPVPNVGTEAKLPESALSGLWGHLCMGRGAMGSHGEPEALAQLCAAHQSSGGNLRLRHPPARWQPCGDAQASLFAISAPFSPKVSERRGSTPFHSSLRYLDLFRSI